MAEPVSWRLQPGREQVTVDRLRKELKRRDRTTMETQ